MNSIRSTIFYQITIVASSAKSLIYSELKLPEKALETLREERNNYNEFFSGVLG